MCSAKPELLEHCAKFAAAPRMYAQLGYRAAWWLYTPLQYAAFHNKSATVVEALLELSSDVNNMGALQVSPMHIACVNNNVAVVGILLNARRYGCEPPDLELKDARGRTPNQVAKGAATAVLFANVVVKEVGTDEGTDDADTEWEVIDIVGLKTTAEHSAGCQCMQCLLHTEAKINDPKLPSADAPPPSSISAPTAHSTSYARVGTAAASPSSSITTAASATSDARESSETPSPSSHPRPFRPDHPWKPDGLTFKLFSLLFANNEPAEREDSPAALRALSEEQHGGADGPADSSPVFAEYIQASEAKTADERSVHESVDDASIVTFGLVEYDDLTIANELATGSYGIVYEAKWRGYPVAVKMLFDRKVLVVDSDSASKTGVEQTDALVQEIRLFQELKHDNIITFIGACSYGSHFYICTELATNGSLYNFLHKESNQYALADARQWGMEIARGMHFLSEKNIMHRDLKSPNILLTTTDAPGSLSAARRGKKKSYSLGGAKVALTAKICDFGLSHKNQGDLNTGDTKGTFRWMAPEVIKEELITFKCDVYSYGIVLWELLTREIPFSDMPLVQVVWAVAQCNERPELPSTFPTGFHDLVEQCWQHDPEHRPSWWDVITHLQTCDLDLDGPVYKSSEPTPAMDSVAAEQVEQQLEDAEDARVVQAGKSVNYKSVRSSGRTTSSASAAAAAASILSAGPDGLLQTQGSWSREISAGHDRMRQSYLHNLGISPTRNPPSPLHRGRQTSNAGGGGRMAPAQPHATPPQPY
jgi:serine/threonine protein kinase